MQRRQFLLSAAVLSSGLLPAQAERPEMEKRSESMQGNERTQRPGATWRTAAALPVKTQEIYPTVHNGKLIVAGGIARKLGVPYFSDESYRYDPVSDRWAELASLPEALHHAALTTHDGDIILAGGFNGGYTHIWRMRGAVYRLLEEGWVADGELPQPRAEGVLTTRSDGTVHLVTGQTPRGADNRQRSDHTEVVDHWIRAAGSQRWESLAPIPTARNSATGGWLDGQLVVSGGRTAAGNLDTTEIYDVKEDRWREAAPLPLPQAGTASAVVDDELIVFGGEIFQP
ncbi:MAG: kelch repeat-containing protein [Pseudomonadota bacterium]